MKILEHKATKTFAANTYIINDGDTNIIIDPGDFTGDFEKFLILNNIEKVEAVLLTHAHFDHIRDLKRLLKKFDFNIYLSNEEIPVLLNPTYNESTRFGKEFKFDEYKDKLIGFNDNEMLKFKNISIKCILTPFHTIGSACYYIKETNDLFTGDTLFKDFIGRTDLIASCPHKTTESLNKLKLLPQRTKIYPGHDDLSTLEYEFAHNPFLK